jgi:hypothetical protein
MAFSDPEIQEIKNRLGYGNLTELALPYVDVALVFETVVQNNTDAYGEARVRTVILPNLRTLDGGSTDATGGIIAKARTRYGIKELVGDVVFDTGGASGGETQFDGILREKEYWISELESTVKVPRARKLTNGQGCEVY